MLQNDSGLFTVESLMSACLATILLGALSVALTTSLSHYLNTKQYRSNLFSAFKTEELLRQVFFDLDGHAFDLSARIHENGQINYSDGTPNPISQTSSLNAPSGNSQAISAFKLELLGTHTVYAREISGENFRFQACPRYKTSFHPSEHRGYLAVHSDGFSELAGLVSTPYGPKGCRDFSLTPTQSMIAEINNNSAQFAYQIIPILENYTLYVSRKGELRRLGHQGAYNVENQPVTMLKKLSLALVYRDTIRLLELQATLDFKNSHIYQFRLYNFLERRDYLNFLLQKP